MHSGSCHCGRMRFEVAGEVSEAMECNCSHCSRKGYLLWFVPRGQVTFAAPLEDLSTYRFNRHVIDHHFCPVCGCAPFGLGTDPDGNAVAAINIRCLEDVDLGAIRRIPVDGRAF